MRDRRWPKFVLLLLAGLACEREFVARPAFTQAPAPEPAPSPSVFPSSSPSPSPSPSASPSSSPSPSPSPRPDPMMSAIADQNKRLDAVLTGLTALVDELRAAQRGDTDLATQEIVLRELTRMRSTLETIQKDRDDGAPSGN